MAGAGRIVIPPRGVGVSRADDGKFVAYVDTAVYIDAKGVTGELPEIVFYTADPSENSNQIRTALEAHVKSAFGASASTPVTWLIV